MLTLANPNNPSDVDYVFKKPKRPVSKVYFHCSASSDPNHADVSVIKEWHLKRGWSDVGYHYFIPFNGEIQLGRSIELVPSAQQGHNTGSIAICLAGLRPGDFTFPQFDVLLRLSNVINNAYNQKLTFHGHCEVSKKACPVFDYKRVANLDQAGRFDMGPYRKESMDMFDSGIEVYLLQRRLNIWLSGKQNPTYVAPDGIFGNTTAMAVIDFQKENGLKPDGIVGPITKLKLPSFYS